LASLFPKTTKSFLMKLKHFVFILILCLLPILLIEGLLQIIDKPSYKDEVRVGWKYQGIATNVNQLGYRGQEINYSDNDFIIILLGDSQVEADAMTPENMPEKILERYLKDSISNVKVFSLGSGGQGNDQQMEALQAYFKKYRADLVLQWLTPANDVWNNLFPTHIPKDGQPKPTYRLENGQLAGPYLTKDSLIIKNSPWKLVHLFQRVFLNPLKGIDEAYATKYLPEPIKGQTEEPARFFDWKLPEIENFSNEKTHFILEFENVSPRTKYGIALTKELLKKTQELTEGNKAKYILFNRESEPKASSDTSSYFVFKNNEYYKVSKKTNQKSIETILKEFPSYDIPLKVKDYRVSENDGHLNLEGNLQVLKTLSDSLLANHAFTQKRVQL
jgi:hypothetical protein